MEKIRENIYAFIMKLPFPATPELTVYFLDGERPAIIDTGLGNEESMKAIAKELGEIGRSIDDISVIINTHEHVEHFGGNRKIMKVSDADAISSEKAAPFIEKFHQFNNDISEKYSGFDNELSEVLQGLLKFNLTIDESEITRRVIDGEVVDLNQFMLRVVETPGHAHGHICLYDEEKKILFTGDHVIATGSTFVGYGWRELAMKNISEIFSDSSGTTDNITMYLESLQKLQGLDIELMLPAHGAPIADPKGKLEEEILRKIKREERFMTVISEHGEMMLDELIGRVYSGVHLSFLLRGAALGYLERLNRAGLIEATVQGNDLLVRLK